MVNGTDRVVLDTSAIYAITSDADRFHQSAMDALHDLTDQQVELFTNSYVLLESAALIHRRLGFAALRSFMQSIRGVWEIQWIDQTAHEAIWERMDASGGRLNLVDWSVIVMAEQTRSAIFTFDSDFAKEGLRVVPARAG